MTKAIYPRIILALGGGGARGFAHIGVLQVLIEAKIQIAGIVGTSMGALIGSTYASGTDIYYLGRLIENLGWENLIDIRLPRWGLIDGAKVKSLIDLLTKHKCIEELHPEFWAVATDLFSGDEVVFKEGPLSPAIRASISIPGIFAPVEYDGKILVDGAVVSGVPVRAAREMNGDLVVAVNVSYDHTQRKVNNIVDVMSKVFDIMTNRLDALQFETADLSIKPQLGTIDVLDFPRANECIGIGRRAMEKALPQLQEMIMNQLRRKESKEA